MSKYDINTVVDMKTADGTVIALIKRKSACQPFCVAWGYDITSGTWGQGHYFTRFTDAVECYNDYGLDD